MNNTILIRSTLIAAVVMTITACSTVRDTTDWIPGVDSNEEIKADEQKEMREAIERERELYKDKHAFAPISRTSSEADARISVLISQKYAALETINPEDIGIEVNAGVVTLTGNINSDESAVSAISIAKSTQGVVRVISKLVVINVRSRE